MHYSYIKRNRYNEMYDQMKILQARLEVSEAIGNLRSVEESIEKYKTNILRYALSTPRVIGTIQL
jgi:hypothetical protein